MKHALLTTLCTVLLVSTVSGADFWFGVDGTVPLSIDSLKVTVKFESGIGIDSAQALIEQIDRINAAVPDEHTIDGFVVYSLTTGQGYEEFLDSLTLLSGITLVEPYYLSENGNPTLVGEDICVAFHEGVSVATIDSLNSANHVTTSDSLEGMPGFLFIRNTKHSGRRTVELGNYYHNLELVRFAHSDFTAAIELDSYTLYDYYADYQWHPKRIIGEYNSASVWDFAGLDETGITVAVLDNGVDAHEDLPSSRLLPGYDFGNMDTDPKPDYYAAHGMMVASIIGASHTTDSNLAADKNTGVISMNPNVTILPIRIYGDSMSTQSTEHLAQAINYAREQGADILSNSWSFKNPRQADIPIINEVIERAYAYGRNGLGCPVTHSAGNGGDTIAMVNYPGRLGYCFAVGATDYDDCRFGYSSYGDGLDIVAPSGGYTGDVWFADQMGDLGGNPAGVSSCPPGDNDTDYNCVGNGTSAAQPLVAGAAALLLTKDPTLTSSQVYFILRYSAVTNICEGTITPPNDEYGYGRVDAFRAILSISRGDVNNDGYHEPLIDDIVYLVTYMFQDGPAPFPSELLADVDCDGAVDIADVIYLMNYMFQSGPALVNPCFKYEPE